jgi:hypothetical protein
MASMIPAALSRRHTQFWVFVCAALIPRRVKAGTAVACTPRFPHCVAHAVKEKISMEDLSWLRLLQKPRVDKTPPEAIERKLRALQLIERDGKQLAVTRKGQIAIRLFG